MNNNYINLKLKKQKNNEEISSYIFGMFFGFSITIIFIFRILSRKFNIVSYIDLLFMFYGIFCILLATINPNFKILKYIKKGNAAVFNFIGNLILKLILLVIYIVLVTPIGRYMPKKINKEKKSNFVEYTSSYNAKLGKYKFLKIFKLFASEYFYMIPLIIILLLISIFVVVLSSNVITPLIYTLF